jgi:predicted membrane chloride channel (bestrophin family)
MFFQLIFLGLLTLVLLPKEGTPFQVSKTITDHSSIRRILDHRLRTSTNNNFIPRQFITQLHQQRNWWRETIQASEEEREESRKLRRTIFTHTDWKRHRSSDRYFHELLKMPQSQVLRGLTLQAVGVALVSAVVVIYNVLMELKLLNWPIPLLTVPFLPLSITSSSLGLLLVFRTNTAYDRWKEARNLWSIISAKSFDIMRQTNAWITDDKAQVSAIFRYTSAFSRCLKWHLGDRSDSQALSDDLQDLMLPSEIEAIIKAKHKPKYVLARLSCLLATRSMLMNMQTHVDRAMIELTNAMEGCDRIFTTPIPLVYTKLTARFLLLWLMMLPMSLYNEFPMDKKWVIPLVVFLNSIFMLGIEDLGVQIEEPFSIMPLASICHNIKSGAQELLQENGNDWFHGTEKEESCEATMQ